jgi:hypothetical protein
LGQEQSLLASVSFEVGVGTVFPLQMVNGEGGKLCS